MSQFVRIGGSGCLLPSLIIFNLFFGRLIFGSIRLWLGIEVLLILIFMIKINIMMRKISRQFRPGGHDSASGSKSPGGNSNVIDIQGQVVEEDEQLG